VIDEDYPSEAQLEQFPEGPDSSESRFARSLRMMRASFTVLREDPELMAFPAVSLLLSVIVGVFCFGAFASNADGPNGARDALLVPGLIAAYPLSFVSVYFSVALAAVLGARLDGERLTLGQGLSAANRKIGVIAAWTLLVCTVGAVLRLLEERLPLAGRVAASLFGLGWSLATLFAVPVLAFEGLGPFKTVERSTAIFKRRWGAQIGGTAGIGLAGSLVAVPFALLLVAGVSTGGRPGGALIAIGAAGLFAATATVSALEQIYRVFVYRNALGQDVSGGPFSQRDLRQPLTRRGR
jgi:Family of unknown function (DUF6159)